MSDIIEKMALIKVPNDFLQRIDVGSVIERMHRNFRKLDSLKDFRGEHEKRNAFMRWWDNDKLEDAQLDAQELQAEFSKSLSQLMMIVLLQSQRIASQQAQITAQQKSLSEQADGLAEQTGSLAKQQDALKEQAEALEALVTNYVALRGLTEDGARKLMEVATDVKNAREHLQQRFDVALARVEASVEDIGERHMRLEQEQYQLHDAQTALKTGAETGRAALQQVQQVLGTADDRGQHLEGAMKQVQRQLRVLKLAVGVLWGVLGAAMGWQLLS